MKQLKTIFVSISANSLAPLLKKRTILSLGFLFCLSASSVFAQNLCKDRKVSVYFNSDSHDLSTNSKAVLDSLLATSKGNYIEVHGFTDRQGNEAYNKELSSKRSNSVFQYLVQSGLIDSNKINSFHFGESDESNSSKNLDDKSRRVDVYNIPIFNDRFFIYGKNGASIGIPYSRLKKSICNCDFQLVEQELKMGETKKRKHYSSDSHILVNTNTVHLKSNPCLVYSDVNLVENVQIIIPLKNYNSRMKVFTLPDSLKGGIWQSQTYARTYDSLSKCITISIPMNLWEPGDWICYGDVARLKNGTCIVESINEVILRPKLIRHQGTLINGDVLRHDNLVNRTVIYMSYPAKTQISPIWLTPFKGNEIICDFGYDSLGQAYFLNDTLYKYLNDFDLSYTLNLAAYHKVNYLASETIIKCKNCDFFKTTFPQVKGVYVDNQIYMNPQNLIQKILKIKRYKVPIPSDFEFEFELNNRTLLYPYIKKKYKKRKNAYFVKLYGRT